MSENRATQNLIAGAGCFRKGAQVQLEGGLTKSIEELQVGDEVLSFNEDGKIEVSKVTKVHFHADPQPILRVKFWKGMTHITPNHWVLNQYQSFVEMGSLTAHDALVDGMGHLRPIIGAELTGFEPVYNLTVEPNHTFICDGVRVHNGGHRERYPVAGAGGGGGGKGDGGGSAKEDADTLQSRAMVSLLDLLGAGEIGGLVAGAQSIFLNDTPLQNPDGSFNYTGVSWDQRTGSQGQSAMPGFDSAETPYNVSVRVRADTPHAVTISNPNADQVRVILTIPSLMTQDTSNGDIHGADVTIRIDIATDNGPYYDASGPLTISGKQRQKFQKSYLLNLPKPGSMWNIRMVRLSGDATTANISNETYFDSYVEIVNAKLRYPNSALVGMRLDASQISSVPTRSYLVNGMYIRVPSNYNADSHTYSGVWNGTFKVAISGNPAWVLFEFLTNKLWGLGNYLDDSQIDVATLYQIGRYCDEFVPDGFGGWEPRFEMRTVFAQQADAYKIISDICSAFRGMCYWSGGMAAFTQDAPATPSTIFTPANVIDGVFTYSGSAHKDRHTVALITWNDPKENFKQKIEYVEDAEQVALWGVRKIEMVSFGCASRGQANRAGRWILYTERYESDLVQFKVGMDAAMVLPGEIIKIHDTFRAGKRMGGRLKSATTKSAVLDSPIELTTGNAVISLRLPDGTFIDRTLNEDPGTYETVTWIDPLPDTPMNNGMWLIAEANLKPMLARVLGVTQGSDPGTFEIVAMEHNPTKYDAIEKGWALEVPKTSIIDTKAVATPSNLTAVEEQYVVAPSVVGTRINLSWSGLAPTYEVRWRVTGKYQTDWATITTSSASLDFENVKKGVYEFQVCGVNTFGYKSTLVKLSHSVVGKTTAPGDVVNFKVTKRTSDLLATWDAVKDIDIMGYEIREGVSWDGARVVTANFKGTMITDDQDEAGTYHYHIRSIDTSGNYSDNVSTFDLILEPPAPVSQFDAVQSINRLEFRWLANTEVDIVGYEIREGPSWNTSQLIAQVMATTYTMPAGAAGDRLFWIKAIASPGIYSATAMFVQTAVAQPSNMNVIYTDDEVVRGFPGVRHHLSRLNDALVMDNGAARGEYIFTVDLHDQFRAQNSIFFSIDSIAQDLETWATTSRPWADMTRQWTYDGSINSVSARCQIAPFTGLRSNEVDGVRGDLATTTVTGHNPAEMLGVSYAQGRYGNGIMVTDLTQISWAMTVPPLFSVVFWIVPKEVTDCTFWSARDGQKSLTVGYSARRKAFYLEDQLSRQVVVPFEFAANDRICVGVCQAQNTRKLFIGRMGDTQPVMATGQLDQQGAYSKVAFY
ncbi:TipJ family phage tail tip protein [Herbaspirillum huttiense]|uniref:Phage tail protein n=1 Tax=Herbaspirillum huttiense subsp. lycopersici TaxID=3074428 RepID=A0ABU2EGK2_9BURK|nr:phage tail protein [Herbaspirillum huttiense]MDR9847010.1 phage tail protein [Herbaspirillum huttiense SE1]